MPQERQSNFELLRIIAIVFVVTMHILGKWWNTTSVVNSQLIVLANAVGNTCVILFMLISGYFGMKLRGSKLYHLQFVALTYSLPVLVLSYLYAGGLADIGGGKLLIRSIFPLMGSFNWFISIYAAIYALSPFLNKTIDALNRREFQLLLLLLVFLFYIAPTFLIRTFMNDTGKNIGCLTTLYFLGRYLRLYGIPQWFLCRRALKFFTIAAFVYVVNGALTYLSGQHTGYFSYDHSIFELLLSLLIFSWAAEWNFRSKVVNRLATYAFPLCLGNNVILLLLSSYITPLADTYWCWAALPVILAICFVVIIIYEEIRAWLLTPVEHFIYRHLERWGLRAYEKWMAANPS